MTISAVPRDVARSPVEGYRTDVEADTLVRIGIHDASRLEWSVLLPLPGEADRAYRYAIQVEIEIPSNALALDSPWDQIQSFTRLDGPLDRLQKEEGPIDALRRGALSLAHELAQASDGFARDCRLANSGMLEAPPPDLESALKSWIDISIKTVGETRARLCVVKEDDAPELVCERNLVDEYASVRLLEMLGGADRALGATKSSRHIQGLAPMVANVEGSIVEAVEKELVRRLEKGYVVADSTSIAALERYLSRASRLETHFQEMLFLEADRFEVAQRLHHWLAVVVALAASSWALVWQIALTKARFGPGTQIALSVIFVALVIGVIYAAKDRIRELGRAWISGNVHRRYAQRVARFRMPRRRLPSRGVIVAARESIDQETVQIADTLNPERGATMPATLIKYVHRGRIEARSVLFAQWVSGIEHVFRYDLSPLFAHLDDATESVPVPDAATRRLRPAEAPSHYRLPVRVSVQTRRCRAEESATVVVRKDGLDRLERRPTGVDCDVSVWRAVSTKQSEVDPGLLPLARRTDDVR
jgi:hypothetical protein